jgi:hypothetical protein
VARKKKESHEAVEHEHITDDAVQLSQSWIATEEETKGPEKIESDLEKHPKFSKFKGEMK